MTEAMYLAISRDNLSRAYGYSEAAGHALMIPSGFQGDPIAAGKSIRRLCGGMVDAARLVEKFTGDKMCKRCETKITSDLISAAEADMNVIADTTDPSMTGTAAAIDDTADTVQETRMSMDDALLAADAMRYDTIRPGLEFKWDNPLTPGRKTDSKPVKVEKCAVKGTHKVAPKPGTDTDGVNGTCPVCHTFAKLTGKGFIGTHTTTGETEPAAPTLPQKSVKAVDTGTQHGDPSDAAKRREGEAYTTTGRGKNKVVTPVVPIASESPIGQRDHGMSDGPAMLPKGTYANGSSPDRTITTIPKVGRNGTLTQDEYAKLGRSAQRRYWRKLAQNNK